jgi:hypothetical protein
MTPEQMRARADREERVYAAPDLAKMLRAGADAMEERDRLLKAGGWLSVCAQTTGGTAGRDDALVQAITMWRMAVDNDADGLAYQRQNAPLTPPVEVYDFNDRYDAAWKPEEKAE